MGEPKMVHRGHYSEVAGIVFAMLEAWCPLGAGSGIAWVWLDSQLSLVAGNGNAPVFLESQLCLMAVHAWLEPLCLLFLLHCTDFRACITEAFEGDVGIYSLPALGVRVSWIKEMIQEIPTEKKLGARHTCLCLDGAVILLHSRSMLRDGRD